MNIVSSTSRFILVAAAAAFVTAGCGGGAGPTGAQPLATDTPAPTGGNAEAAAPAGDPAPDPSPAPAAGPHSMHRRCGWIGADTWDAGKASFLANPDYYDAIHPFWATLNPDGSARMLPIADDAELTAAAHAHHVALMPLIYYDDPAILRNAIATPAGLQAHAQMLADLVEQHGWDGIELDYEHLWSASDRAPYSALVAQVADLLHKNGKKLSLAVPALDKEYPDSGYDYPALQKSADVLHLMGYDYHYLGGDHLGPLAPKGWIDNVLSYVESLGAPDKYILGIANYGVGAGWYTSAKDAAARCIGGTHTDATDHMATCSYGHQDAGLAPHCNTAKGQIWFEDVASMTEKATMAKTHHLLGVGVYAMGDEPDGFFAAMLSQFPND